MVSRAKVVTRVAALLLLRLVIAPPTSLQERQRDETDGHRYQTLSVEMIARASAETAERLEALPRWRPQSACAPTCRRSGP